MLYGIGMPIMFPMAALIISNQRLAELFKLLTTWSNHQRWTTPWVSQCFQSWSSLLFACFLMLSGCLTIDKYLITFGYTKTRQLIIWSQVILLASELIKHHLYSLQLSFVASSSLYKLSFLTKPSRDLVIQWLMIHCLLMRTCQTFSRLCQSVKLIYWLLSMNMCSKNMDSNYLTHTS